MNKFGAGINLFRNEKEVSRLIGDLPLRQVARLMSYKYDYQSQVSELVISQLKTRNILFRIDIFD